MMGKGGVEPHRPTSRDDYAFGAVHVGRVEGSKVCGFADPAGDLELKQGRPCEGSGSELNHAASLGWLGVQGFTCGA
jgi:hypothetical protein